MASQETAKKDVFSSLEEEMPTYLNIMRFAEARAQEVKKMINALQETNGSKLIFQQLPKRMRRRVMGHNIKRLPQKLREAHLNQLKKSGMPVKSKRPSRKYRRKPSNLLLEYNRRKKRISWLETHIWHAKRFHMTEKWGYKVPNRSCDKTFRSCYRATTRHCLLQDISYFSCIEISGNENVIIDNLKHMTNKNTGLTIAAQAYINSQREGTAIFYKKDAYPFGAIGEVRFIWKPFTDNNRILWLWVHPAIYSELLENLLKLFNLNLEPGNMTNIYLDLEINICVKILKNHFNRFRLTGPLSNAIIQNAFKPPSSTNQTEWFDKYLNLDQNRQIFFDQCEFWRKFKCVQSPSELSPHLIINMIITDPRYNFPQKRTKALPDNNNTNDKIDVTSNLKFGKIWEYSNNKLVSESKMSTAQFLKDRANLLVTEDIIPDTATALPIMIIQRPGVNDGSNIIGYGSGYDIIIPSGWAMPVWLCLIMWGARVGALRESETIQYEMGRYDILPPDTKAGETEDQDTNNKYREKYFRLPPAKRTNYNKFGICSPFSCQWKKLINEWKPCSENLEEFYILRDRKILLNLQEILKPSFHKKPELLKNIGINLNENCLIPIKLTLLNKGRATRYAIICLPEPNDLSKKLTEPFEVLHNDPNQNTRKELRKEHKIFLKRMSRRRGRAKKNGKILQQPTEKITEQHKKMESLWLPEAENIKDSCSRKVIGFITKGDVSYMTGHGQSIGYIPLGVIGALLQTSQVNKVLVRNTYAKKYRFAKLEVILNNT